ncbi:MAG: cytochrome P450 [Betaproteobacteria bacterium]|nr:MAG: cytochrome P450 [Betaproteobacteria bacterium]
MVHTQGLIDAAFLDDPYPTYRALREAGPIHWSEDFFGGAWLLTHHADVDAALRDPRLSAQRTGGWVMDSAANRRHELLGFQQLFARAMLFLDAPEHPRIRRVLNAGFRADAMQRLAPRIKRLVDELLDSVDARSGFDFMQAVARPLPARVIAMLMGVDDADHDEFVDWSDDLAAFIGAARPTLDQARRAQASLVAMSHRFEALLAQRRRAPADDIVSRLLHAEAAGEIQAGPELLAQCAMLLFAGHETTRNLLGNGLRALLAHPAQWQALQRDPTPLPGAVRELLRYDSPVQYTGRRVACEMVLHGEQLRRGDLVLALIGSANRDPTCFTRPDVLDVTRREAKSLSFGSGPHVCIGAALTLLETETLLREVLRRWPRLGLAETAARWNGNPVYRGLASLPLRSP